jgi:hypothetical protein
LEFQIIFLFILEEGRIEERSKGKEKMSRKRVGENDLKLI